jgi:hypothetical protein
MMALLIADNRSSRNPAEGFVKSLRGTGKDSEINRAKAGSLNAGLI